MPIGSSAAPRARPIIDLPLIPPLRMSSSAKPSRGTTRVSIPRAVPANTIRVSGRRASSSRATAMPGYRWPPVPPPAIMTRNGSFISVVSGFRLCALVSSSHASDDACCETLSRTPMPSRLMISDDPPALTNGRGMPLVGIRPSTTLMLTNA